MTSALDLSACDREPIHIPGSIQPHGFLLAVDPATGRVEQSAGSDSLAGLPIASLLGGELDALLQDRGPRLKDLVNGVGQQEPSCFGTVRLAGSEILFDLLAHEKQGLLMVELEPRDKPPLKAGAILAAGRRAAARVAAETNVTGACQTAAREVRALLGYDRVMIYRFLEDGTGDVVAQSRVESAKSYLNHRFPASDIPKQARELYTRNLVRVIPDAGYVPAPLISLAPGAQPLDMSDCVLRSISPIHVQYLKNMGVGASASFSILKDGKLWGLIACHHSSAKKVPWELRETGTHLAQSLSHQIKAQEESDRHLRLSGSARARGDLLARLKRQVELDDALAGQVAEIGRLFDCDGAAVVLGSRVETWAAVPPREELHQLTEWLVHTGEVHCFSTQKLTDAFRPAGSFTSPFVGMLATVLDADRRVVLMWFRAEQMQTIEWAGNPHKLESTDPSIPLSPRRSFETWREGVSGSSRPWHAADVEAAEALMTALVDLRRQRELGALNEQLERSLAEERKSRSDIERLQARIVQLSRVSAMGTMASTLAHELNQPLLAISNYVSAGRRLLQQGGDDNLRQADEALNEACECITRAAEVITKMRKAVMGPESGKASIDLEKLVPDACSLALTRADAADVRLKLEVEPGASACGDELEIGQVLHHLIENALEAMTGSTRKMLTIQVVSGDETRVSVTDTGPGVPAELADAPFTAFSSSKPGHKGIGLAACRTIVEAQGGKIWHEAREDGTSFVFTLPTS